MLFFEGFCLPRLGFQVSVDFPPIGVVVGESRMNLRQRQAALGGRFIPDAGVRRRYARSIANAAQALRLANVAAFYDNSGDAHRLILVVNATALPRRKPA